VFIFFFISGFVVSKTCLDEMQMSGEFSIKGFYIRRAFRIIPPLLLYLITCSVLSGIGLIKFLPENFLSASVYLCNTTLSFVHCDWYTGHTWSLAFEEQFYLCFPILFSFVVTRKTMSWLTPVVLAIATLPFFFNIHWIGKTGFIVIYSLFFAGYFAARNIVYWQRFAKSPYLYSFALISTVIVFFPIPHFDSLFLGKFYKFLYIPTIPIMVLTTGFEGGFLNKIFSVAVDRLRWARDVFHLLMATVVYR
jgi:peptidoglycan/LPS O-acetylase OafA/YrhL